MASSNTPGREAGFTQFSRITNNSARKSSLVIFGPDIHVSLRGMREKKLFDIQGKGRGEREFTSPCRDLEHFELLYLIVTVNAYLRPWLHGPLLHTLGVFRLTAGRSKLTTTTDMKTTTLATSFGSLLCFFEPSSEQRSVSSHRAPGRT